MCSPDISIQIPFTLDLPETRVEVAIEVPADRPMRLSQLARKVLAITDSGSQVHPESV